MKKKLFMYVLIILFVIIMGLYAFNAIETVFIKSVDVINETLDEKAIIFFEETSDDNESRGLYLQNNGNIYSYSYTSFGDKTIEDKISHMKESTKSKIDKISKKDKGYLNMLIGKLKPKYYARKTKSDRPSKYIYYINYDKNEAMPLLSSGETVVKNRGLSSSRIVSILKKYSIRVD